MQKSSSDPKFDHLDYYLANEISPVKQDIDDLNKHLERRGSLYTNLGLPQLLIKGKKILEVGPGSGHNCLYVASCEPRQYDLLEPNKSAWDDIENLFSENSKKIPLVKPNIIKKKLEDFDTDEKYDIVISEGWLGINQNERELMSKLSKFVISKGILVTSLGSPIGYLANTIRRILSWQIIDDNKSIDENTSTLLNAFSSHLNTMNDMSRHQEDWCQDTLLNLGYYTLSPTPEMFFNDIGPEFTVYSSYPKITKDWRWYKTLYGEEKCFNEVFLDEYFKNIHNFFDHNIVLTSRGKDSKYELEKSAFTLTELAGDREISNNRVIDDEVIQLIFEVFERLKEVNIEWNKPFDEVKGLLNSSDISEIQITKMHEFSKLFGRELIYVSAIKQ